MKTMKFLKCLLAASVCIPTVNGQIPTESQRFLTETLNQHNLGKDELLLKFSNFDFSLLWTKNDKYILGFIGDNYQRLNIKYLSVIKNIENPSKYYIYGKSKVKSNVCQFMGEIELIHIRMINDPEEKQLYEEAIRQNDKDAIKRFSKQKYALMAKYHFFEEPNQSGTGIFKRVLKTIFYSDNDKLFYDDLEMNSDNFCNNQCVGIWNAYKSNTSKICNWGEFRIPYSGDLDIGIGEFSPNRKYRDKGWDSYFRAYTLNDANARKEEEVQWW